MANSRGPTSIRHMYYGKNSLLPPKSPFPSILSSCADYIPSSVLGQKSILDFREGNSQHQRTSSESFLMEEQPSWLDDLLNEPDTPVRKGGHCRSSSDSFSYVDSMNIVNMGSIAKEDSIRTMAHPSWNLPKYDLYKDVRHVSQYSDPKSSLQERIRAWNSAVNPQSMPSLRETIMHQSSKSSSKPLEAEVVPPTASEKQETLDAGLHESKGSSERKDPSESMPSASEADTKRTKHQFAQRSRVRKLQYIAELERTVQAVQAESSDISAELEFLGQRNLILSMENKALKQRLESLAQEQLIKYLEHEVLERERGRLRALYQKQKQPQLQPEPKTGGPQRTSSRDLDQQLAKLSLKHKDASHGQDLLSDQLHI
ncbi:basic leucine zipper transcription factor [Lithospermum erythrorhizon]|uniref:Basic leucine zipper transcription factor n=1 Tax=Lithospermum erythrorhizon TaxID=34254 RepID=A0AAV3RNL1_LITER